MASQFTFDPNRCTGCEACVMACWMENRERQSRPWRAVHTFNACGHPDLPVFQLSFACHHCEAPACLEHCPADAYTKDAATGAVTIHADRCMGCRYCTWACPHDAPKFSADLGTIEKCTLCPERAARGLEPACVARCPMGALGLSPLGPRPLSGVAGLPKSDTSPAIRITPLRAPECPALGQRPSASVMAPFLEALFQVPRPKITLRGEWTLLLFTTVMGVLAAWMGAAQLGGPRVQPWAFLGSGALVLGLSTAHLGRPARAWRALRHLRSSWLSREVAAVSAFLGLGALALFALPVLGSLAAVVGFLALFAIDRIYRVALRTGPWNLHSAHTLFNGLYLLALLAGIPFLAFGLGGFKLALYLHRKRHFAAHGKSVQPGVSALRLGLGILAPLLLTVSHPVLAAICAVLGDLVDRGEYYGELEVPTPQLNLAETMRSRIREAGTS
jgi:Fe-S-cluster-containing dehydrogenase component/DMSO reductase anchor subunit